MPPGEPAGTDAAPDDGFFRDDILSRTAFGVLMLFVLGACATPQTPPPGPAPKTAARDAEILVLAGGRSHFFENRRPHCLAYVLDGDWEFAVQKAALRTTDRRRFVGVVLQGAEAIPGKPESDAVARAITQIISDAEKEWGGPVHARVQPFPAFRGGAVLLEFAEVTITPQMAAQVTGPVKPAVGQKIRPPLRVIAPFDARLVMVVTALDLADARAVGSTLEVTEDPQCWRRTIRERFPGVLQ
jgi:hypothetical protein